MTDKLRQVIDQLKKREETKEAEQAAAEQEKTAVAEKPIQQSKELSEEEKKRLATLQAVAELQNTGAFRLHLLNELSELNRNVGSLSDAIKKLIE